MLREEVLRVWGDFKKNLLNDKKLLEELSNNLGDMIINKHDADWIMKRLKEKLPSITQACQGLRSQYANGQFGKNQLIEPVWITYLYYIELVETYQRIVDYHQKKFSP